MLWPNQIIAERQFKKLWKNRRIAFWKGAKQANTMLASSFWAPEESQIVRAKLFTFQFATVAFEMLWLFHVNALEWLEIASMIGISARKLDVVRPVNGIDALHLASHSLQLASSRCRLLCCWLLRALRLGSVEPSCDFRRSLWLFLINGSSRAHLSIVYLQQEVILFLLELAPLPDVQALHLLVELIYFIFHLVVRPQASLRSRGVLPPCNCWCLECL